MIYKTIMDQQLLSSALHQCISFA